MVAATDMTYWVADGRTMEGTKEPETRALCFSLESENLTDYGPRLVCRYYVMKWLHPTAQKRHVKRSGASEKRPELGL